MTQQWCVKAWAGSYSWTVKDDDPAGYGLAAPLTISTSLPTSDLGPLVQPNASTATFRVIVAAASDLSDLQLGAAVTLRYFGARAPAAGDFPVVSFAGRVASLEAEPHDLGLLYTITCVDYTADLGERQVGTVAYPQENLDARVRRILAEAGFNVPAGAALYGPGPAAIPLQATVTARAISPTTCLELLTHTLAQYRMEFAASGPGLAAVGIAQLVQNVSPAAGATFASGASSPDNTAGPFNILTSFQGYQYAAPLRVSFTGGVYLLTASSASSVATGVMVVDGGRVDMATKFSQRKADSANAVQVNSDSFAPQLLAWPGMASRITAAVDTELLLAGDGLALAQTYYPQAQPAQGALWLADSLTWLADQEPGAWSLPRLARGFMVARVKLAWSPVVREWYVGQVAGTTFRLEDGRPYVDVDVAPWNQDPTLVNNPVKWSDLAGGMTYTNMSTRDTFADYALAGI